MKLKFLPLASLLVALSLCINPQAQANLEDDFDSELFDLVKDLSPDDGPLCTVAVNIVPPLAMCGAIDIFKCPFYLSTFPLTTRPLLDMPLFLSPLPLSHEWIFHTHFFYDQTSRSYFSPSSDSITCYLALGQNSCLVQAINTTFENFRNPPCSDLITGALNLPDTVLNANILEIAGLFSNATIQERRVGFMFEAQKGLGPWSIGFKTPFYWIERNAFLTPAEQKALEDARIFPQVSEDEIQQFAHDHLISDKVGFGDTRLTIARELWRNPDATLSGGLEIDAPTALALQKGILGSNFERRNIVPTLNFCDLASTNASSAFRNFGADVLHQFSTVLLEEDLGNRRHWGISLFAEPILRLTETVSWRNRLTAEYLCPADEKRLFVKKLNEQEFDSRDFTDTDPAVAESNLLFLNQRLFDIFLPQAFDTRISPGFLVKAYSALLFNDNAWDGTLGVDFWMQTREHLKAHDPICNDFELARGMRLPAKQLKLFGDIAYTVYRPQQDWTFSLGVDKAFWSQGIGKDFMIDACFKITW